jgi:hypothetical protein
VLTNLGSVKSTSAKPALSGFWTKQYRRRCRLPSRPGARAVDMPIAPIAERTEISYILRDICELRCMMKKVRTFAEFVHPKNGMYLRSLAVDSEKLA